jgi:hypothetical protein
VDDDEERLKYTNEMYPEEEILTGLVGRDFPPRPDNYPKSGDLFDSWETIEACEW